jgi:hypothetical protein
MDVHHVTGQPKKKFPSKFVRPAQRWVLTMDKCTADWPKRKKTEAVHFHPGAAQIAARMNAPAMTGPNQKTDHRNSSARRSAGSVGWITA